MATVFEAMGVSPMGSGSVPAIDPAKEFGKTYLGYEETPELATWCGTTWYK